MSPTLLSTAIASAPPVSVTAAAVPRRRPLLVVAEDCPDQRTMLGFMLECRGFDVVLTANGRDALDAVLVHVPDAVVSDMNMPDIDGLGLCQAMRALTAAKDVPVILRSGVDDDEPRVREAITLGGVEFLSKSVALHAIDGVLRQILSPICADCVS